MKFKKCCMTCKKWCLDLNDKYRPGFCKSKIEKTKSQDLCESYFRDEGVMNLLRDCIGDDQYKKVMVKVKGGN